MLPTLPSAAMPASSAANATGGATPAGAVPTMERKRSARAIQFVDKNPATVRESAEIGRAGRAKGRGCCLDWRVVDWCVVG